VRWLDVDARSPWAGRRAPRPTGQRCSGSGPRTRSRARAVP